MTSPSATVPAFSAAAVSAAASISVVSAYAGFSSPVPPFPTHSVKWKHLNISKMQKINSPIWGN